MRVIAVPSLEPIEKAVSEQLYRGLSPLVTGDLFRLLQEPLRRLSDALLRHLFYRGALRSLNAFGKELGVPLGVLARCLAVLELSLQRLCSGRCSLVDARLELFEDSEVETWRALVIKLVLRGEPGYLLTVWDSLSKNVSEVAGAYRDKIHVSVEPSG